jgi:hypothetical protein
MKTRSQTADPQQADLFKAFSKDSMVMPRA